MRCASYRHDGRMLAAADERGNTQLFDVGARTVMRTFGGHSKAVHVARFAAEGGRLFTASDDTTAICWDVTAEAQLCTLTGHKDFVRSGALSPASPHLFATGSYDHAVKLWDVRANRCVMTLKHVAPVEDVLPLPGGGMLASASGNTLTVRSLSHTHNSPLHFCLNLAALSLSLSLRQVWDILMGKILNAITAHSKTITSLCRDASATHLLSGSLDRSVKAYELSTGQVVGVIKYDAPVLCIALSPMNTHLVAGTTDSCLTVRRKKVGQAKASASAAGSSGEKDPLALSAFGKPGQVAPVSAGATGTADGGPRPGTYRYFLRGRRHAAQSGDVVVNKPNSAKLAGFDKALKRFRYHDALDAALADGSPEVVVSVVEELVQRNGLRISLQGRDQSTLQPLIGFLARQITQPPWAPTLIGVANRLLDMYAPVLGQSAAIDELFQSYGVPSVGDAPPGGARAVIGRDGCAISGRGAGRCAAAKRRWRGCRPHRQLLQPPEVRPPRAARRQRACRSIVFASN